MYIGARHFTEYDADRFVNGEMGDVEFAEADEHQANCDDCHNLMNTRAELLSKEREAYAAEMGDCETGPEDLVWPDDEE